MNVRVIASATAVYLLPALNTHITTAIDTLANSPSSANGYELLWTLLKEFIPMFDRTKPSPFPSWPASDDIFQFARMVIMYCDLSMHKGPHYTEAMNECSSPTSKVATTTWLCNLQYLSAHLARGGTESPAAQTHYPVTSWLWSLLAPCPTNRSTMIPSIPWHRLFPSEFNKHPLVPPHQD